MKVDFFFELECDTVGEGEDQATLFSDQPREWKSETSYQKYTSHCLIVPDNLHVWKENSLFELYLWREPLMLSFHPNSQKHILFVKVNDSDWSEVR